MDIKKFYPSIIAEESAWIIRNMWEECKVTIEGVDFEEVSKYLGTCLTNEEIEKENLKDVLYIKKTKNIKKRITKKVGRKNVKRNNKKTLDTKGSGRQESLDTNHGGGDVTLACDDNNVNKAHKEILDINKGGGRETLDANCDGDSDTNNVTLVSGDDDANKPHNKKRQMFDKPKRNPSTEEKRKMFGKALEILIIAALKNHVYQFGNQIRVQSEGGPIGLKLTGEVADCIMVDWDKKLRSELNKVGIKPIVYTRYKDDIEIVTESVQKGSKLVGEKIVTDAKKEGRR